MSHSPIAALLARQKSEDQLLSPQDVELCGWVRTRRDASDLSFLAVHDGSCFAPMQVLADNTLDNYTSEVLKLTAGCSVRVKGALVDSPAKGQEWEVKATAIEVLGWIDDPETYPMQPKRHSMEHLREYAHLRHRTNIIGAINRVRHTAANSIHNFFDREGYFWANTPIITASDCEGAGELFRVSTLDYHNLPRNDKGEVDFSQDFFGKQAWLTVSGQLNAETMACAMGKVYTFGPTFRAENSNTSRHLGEFWMVEPEVAFATLDDVAELAEQLLKAVCIDILERRADDMAFFDKHVDKGCIGRIRQLSQSRFTRMTYSECIDVLLKSGKPFAYPVAWGMDMQSEHERYLAEEYVNGPLIVTDYPAGIKAFYMRMNDDGKTVAAMDVLAPGIGEIIGGSQREERLEVLDTRIVEAGMNPKDYNWYRDLRRYGTVAHAGFGLGFERLLGYLTGVANVRELIPFPRTPRNASF